MPFPGLLLGSYRIVAHPLCHRSTDDEFLNYMLDFYFPGASIEEVVPLLALYPNDPAQGSPFGTGDANQLAPMYKRVAAFQGDFLFQAQRRSLLALRSSKQPAWSYCTWVPSLLYIALALPLHPCSPLPHL